MKLKKWEERDKKKIGIIIFTVACILLIAGVFIYETFAVFETKKDFNVIEGKVEPLGDLYFAFYVDDVASNTMPSKDSGYVYDEVKSNCTNGASPEFNKDDWSVKVKDMTKTRTKCTIYFKKYIPPATTYITDLAKTDTINLAYDNTVDNNLRYIGKDPNNYVTFNNELWRIIGVMNNVEDDSGTKASHLKLIKESKIGNFSWDYTSSGSYTNDWSTSTLKEMINNGAYYNRTTGTYYNNSTTAINVDFTSNGLTPEAKTMIENIKWKLGGTSSYTTASNGLASHWYGYERGTTVYNGRPTEWIGKVGLMYPSDYGYATSGGATTNRESCLAKELYNWDATEVSDCKNNDWLYNSSTQWTLSPDSDSSNAVFDVYGTGCVRNSGIAYFSNGVSPAVYLLSEIKISSGSGTKLAPYTLTVG